MIRPLTHPTIASQQGAVAPSAVVCLSQVGDAEVEASQVLGLSPRPDVPVDAEDVRAFGSKCVLDARKKNRSLEYAGQLNATC